MVVTERSDRYLPQRHGNLTTRSNRTVEQVFALPNWAVLEIKRHACAVPPKRAPVDLPLFGALLNAAGRRHPRSGCPLASTGSVR